MPSGDNFSITVAGKYYRMVARQAKKHKRSIKQQTEYDIGVVGNA